MTDQAPRPLYVLRTIAETTASHIVKMAEHALPDVPGLSPGDLQLLAGCYIELRDQVRALHDLADLTDPNDPIGRALSRVGLSRRPLDVTESAVAAKEAGVKHYVQVARGDYAVHHVSPEYPEMFAAHCSCGWEGAWVEQRDFARAHGTEHVAEEERL